jgi:hypothetical protein
MRGFIRISKYRSVFLPEIKCREVLIVQTDVPVQFADFLFRKGYINTPLKISSNPK